LLQEISPELISKRICGEFLIGGEFWEKINTYILITIFFSKIEKLFDKYVRQIFEFRRRYVQ